MPFTITPVQVPGRPDMFGSDREGFELSERYEISSKQCLGWGAYGCVARARDTKTGVEVAVKKVKDVCTDGIRAKNCLREVAMLRHFMEKVAVTFEGDDGSHSNILKLLDLEVPSTSPLQHLYVVTELYDTTLKQILMDKWVLTEQHRALLTYQLLRGLKCIHGAGCVHRDIKPENLLIKHADDTYYLAICDLGSGKGFEHPMMTNTRWVTTRWYVPPEALVRDDDLSPFETVGNNVKEVELLKAIDTWSAGCVLGEMLTGKELFKDERGPASQLLKMKSLLGPPTPTFISTYFPTTPPPKGLTLPSPTPASFPTASPTERSLLSSLLVWDPSDRVDVTSFISHPYFLQEDCPFHDPEDEPVAEKFSYEDLEGDPVEKIMEIAAAVKLHNEES